MENFTFNPRPTHAPPTTSTNLAFEEIKVTYRTSNPGKWINILAVG